MDERHLTSTETLPPPPTSTIPTRKYRKLRIAWSVTLGILCLLLVVLWVGSYWRMDILLVRLSPTRVARVGSISGGLLIRFPANDFSADWLQKSTPLTGAGIAISPFRFGSPFGPVDAGVQISHWSVVASARLLAALPWFSRCFSLRTLLMAMTVAAIGLGWIAYMVRY